MAKRPKNPQPLADRWQLLSKKDAKPILEAMHQQWGAIIEGDYQYLLTNRGRVQIIHKDAAKIDFRKLRIDTMGLYVAEYRKDQIRLSIEGSQLVGPNATKNVVELDKNGAIAWLRGEDVKLSEENSNGRGGQLSGYILVKHGNDFLGSGAYKEGTLLNHVPKARRLLTSDLSS